MISMGKLIATSVLLLGAMRSFSATPLTLGATYAGTIALPGQTNAYTFTAVPGQQLFFDSYDYDNLHLYVTLYSPGGVALYSGNDDYDVGPWPITEPGTYTLAFNGSGSTTGTYQFRLLDLGAAPALSLTTPLVDQLSPPLACNAYRLNGKRGQRINLQTISYSTNLASWKLLTPADVVLASGQIYQNLGTMTLPIDGTYYLLISGADPGSTPLTFQVQATDVSDGPVSASGFGTTQSGTVNANQTNTFNYAAPAGLPVFFDSQDKSGQSLLVDLIDPTGNAVFSVGETADSGPYILPRSGNYTVAVRGANGASGNFSFRLLDLSASPTLPLSARVTNTLNAPYETDVYQFNGSAGQRLYFDSLISGSLNLSMAVVGPDGQAVLSAPASSDAGPASLLYSGTYYVYLQNNTSSSETCQFQMIDVGAQPEVPLNGVITGTLAPNSTVIYTLPGSAAEQLYFYGNSNGAGAAWTLYDARNNIVGSAGLGGDFERALPYSCTYALVLTAVGNPVTLSNQVLGFSYSTNALSLGTIVTNNILGPGDQLFYTFTGTAGQKIYYDSLEPAYLSLVVTLISPSGAILENVNAAADFGPLTLPESGTYQLIFSGNSHNTGPIVFQLLDVASQPALSLNADQSGTVAANATQIFQLSGTAGQHLYFQSKSVSTGGGYWSLLDPENNTVGGTGFSGDFQVTLPFTGQYLVLMGAASNPITYSNQVNTFSFITNALTLGTMTTGNIQVPGTQLFYTFSGTAGQRLFYDSVSSAYLSVSVSLIGPSGVLVAEGGAFGDLGPVTLPASGTYMLVLQPSGHTTGLVPFQLLDIAAQPILPLNADFSGTLQPYTTTIYQFAGSLGQQVYFNGKGVSAGGGYWSLFGPANANLGGGTLAQDFQEILPQAGTYVVALQNAANTVGYTNQVNTFSYVTNALTLSSEVTTAVVHPGDVLFYTFNGVPGQRILFNSRLTNSLSFNFAIYSPFGATALSGSAFYNTSTPLTLTQNGTYTLVLSAAGHTTGALSFNLLDLANAPAITFGTTVSDALADPTEMRLYRFSATAGQRVNLQSLGLGGSKAYWELIGPVDQVVAASVPVSQSLGTVALPLTGTYTVAVIGTGGAGSSVPYQWVVTDVSDSPTASSGFGTVHSGTLGSNQTNSFTYTASAGLPVFYDNQDISAPNLLVDIINPDGSTFASFGETSDSGPYVLPRSGTYTVNVRGQSGASGNYSFRLLDLTAVPQLNLNAPVASTLSNPYQTDVYQFTNYPGQVLYYNGLTNDANNPSVSVTLFNAAGQGVGPNGDFQNYWGPFTLQYAGTSYLYLRNSRSTSSSYMFQMQDIATQPSLPLNVFVTNQLGGFGATIYHYTGSAGQQLYFHAQGGNPSGGWYLYDPNSSGVPSGSGGLTTDLPVMLPYTGQYALVLQPSGPAPATEVFQVTGYSYITNSYTIGSAISSAIGQSGEKHFYTFTGSIGQRLLYNALTNDPPSPNQVTVQLFNPQGNTEGPIGGAASANRGPFTLQESGTFTLVVSGRGSSTGAFAFRLLDVSAQPVLPINSPVSNTQDGYAQQVFQYTGSAGQLLYFKGQPGNPSGSWYLYDPNNGGVAGANLSGDIEATLPISGTYVLVLTSAGPPASPENFIVNDFAYFTNSYTIGTQVFDAIQRPGERRYYTFNGSIGQRLVYNALTNDPPSPNVITVQLLNPQGQVENAMGGRFSTSTGPFALQQTGLYTVLIDGYGAGVGAFAFQLLDVSAQPALPVGVAVTNTLGVYPLELYQLAGQPGQNFYFKGFLSNPSGNWTLYDPNNAYVVGSGLTSDFQVTLPLAGTYVLRLGSYAAAAQQVVFAVNSFNAGEPLAINRAPDLQFITNQVAGVGVLVSFTARATDPNNNSLLFSLDPGSPAGAAIDPVSGLFTWNPPVTGLSSVTPVTVRVTNNGNPPLSAAQTLTIEVIAGPTMITVQRLGAVANVSWHSAPTKHYRLQYKNNLSDASWQPVGSDVTATDVVTIQADNIGTNSWRFYRVQALDPLP
ncbi:MAG TPA: cadherin repeat domain-containing protein [Verrucomicrobiae bacterium]|nr:cadherin repeat domain-containing protein [Verrucomicrobiae bacterium]